MDATDNILCQSVISPSPFFYALKNKKKNELMQLLSYCAIQILNGLHSHPGKRLFCVLWKYKSAINASVVFYFLFKRVFFFFLTNLVD